nr:hypothetical protein CFP56_70424 [Quercus suber]
MLAAKTHANTTLALLPCLLLNQRIMEKAHPHHLDQILILTGTTVSKLFHFGGLIDSSLLCNPYSHPLSASSVRPYHRRDLNQTTDHLDFERLEENANAPIMSTAVPREANAGSDSSNCVGEGVEPSMHASYSASDLQGSPSESIDPRVLTLNGDGGGGGTNGSNERAALGISGDETRDSSIQGNFNIGEIMPPGCL